MKLLQRLTREDLFGRECISYFRYSSAPQKWGSTLDRQQEFLDKAMAYFSLVLIQSLTDAASASKGHHHKKGNLLKLLESARAGEFKRGSVVIVEKIDRLDRRGPLVVFAMLKELIVDAGLILVTGHDLCIYDEAGINGDLAHKLLAEIQAAELYTRNLSINATGAHEKRRKALEALVDDPLAPRPLMNSRPPAWLVRDGNNYALQPDRAEAVRLVFDLCCEGYSIRQIAIEMNKRRVKPLPFGVRSQKEWVAPRIAYILRDRATLGIIQPYRREGDKRIATGREVKVYPAVIDASIWVRVRDLLNSRQRKLRGRRGGEVTNLFTGKVFCRTCGASLRMTTGGGLTAGRRNRRLVCSRYRESHACEDSQHYDMHYFEKIILFLLSKNLMSRPTNDDEHVLGEQVAALKITTKTLEANKELLRTRMSTSATIQADYFKTVDEIEAHQKTIAKLEIKIVAAMAPTDQTTQLMKFLGELYFPATNGDIEARHRVRSLLAPLDFRITGGQSTGMILQIDDRRYPIPLVKGDRAHMAYRIRDDGTYDVLPDVYVPRAGVDVTVSQSHISLK